MANKKLSPRESISGKRKQTAEFFSSRKARADFKAFDKLMGRRGGKQPRGGDELPPRTKGK